MSSILFVLQLAQQQTGGGAHNATQPGGDYASRILSLGVVFVIVTGVFFVGVMALLLGALSRRRRAHHGHLEDVPNERHHKPASEVDARLGKWVASGSILTLLILIGLIIASIVTGESVSHAISDPKNAIAIEVTGQQWWWQVRYLNDDPQRIVVTANEIHIPLHRPVLVRGTSRDVIHSLWLPNLQGKRDLIPSRVTTQWLQATRPGVYRGQCAEFCGLQHANMAITVIAEPQEQFEAWMDKQRSPASIPVQPPQVRGQEVFMKSACPLCHAITGTEAQGQAGPDLTHLASRFTLAAGTLPNTKGHLGGWVLDPQNVKPGNHMAVVPIAAADVEPLLAYLGSLK